MLQINPFLDCTLYSRITVHIGQNNQYVAERMFTNRKTIFNEKI